MCLAVLFVVFCHVALMAPSLFVYEGTFLGCHFSSSHLHVSVSVPSHLPHLSATPTPFKPIATFPFIPSHPSHDRYAVDQKRRNRCCFLERKPLSRCLCSSACCECAQKVFYSLASCLVFHSVSSLESREMSFHIVI